MIINQIAKTAHAVHLAYCKEVNEKTQPIWSDLSEDHRQTIKSTVVKILEGNIESVEGSHANFVDLKKTNGWRYGEEYSIEEKTNPRLLDLFSDLPLNNRIKERLFFECVMSFK